MFTLYAALLLAVSSAGSEGRTSPAHLWGHSPCGHSAHRGERSRAGNHAQNLSCERWLLSLSHAQLQALSAGVSRLGGDTSNQRPALSVGTEEPEPERPAESGAAPLVRGSVQSHDRRNRPVSSLRLA